MRKGDVKLLIRNLRIKHEKSMEEIVFHWVVNPTEQMKLNDCADEYKIVKSSNAIAGIVVYGLYHGEWKANPFNQRYLVAALLKNMGNGVSHVG